MSENIEYKDLLNDEKFLLWRISQAEELDEYWHKLLEQHPDLRDRVRQADDYLKSYIFPGTPMNEDNKDVLLAEIYRSLQGHDRKTVTMPVRRWMKYAVAACILFAAGIFLYHFTANRPQAEKLIVVNQSGDDENILFVTGDKTAIFAENVDIAISETGVVKVSGQDNPGDGERELAIGENTLNSLLVPFGKRSKIGLPDGTKVWLNSGSTLDFPSRFDGDRREITIAGEMYIEVAPDKNKPFVVHTPGFDVQVYGTKFNVSVYERRPQTVVLKEGSVGLTTSESPEPFRLSPDEMAVLGNAGFSKQQVDVSEYTSWVDGYIILNRVPVMDALQYIEKYYNFSFDITKASNLKNQTCDGKLYLSENLDNVLRSIALLSDLEYRKENRTIYITNKK